jgi:hypothetical protein
MPGYNSFMGYDPANDVTLIIWTSLTTSLDGQPTRKVRGLSLCFQSRCFGTRPVGVCGTPSDA